MTCVTCTIWVGHIVASLANLDKTTISDNPPVNLYPDEMRPLIGPVGLMAVQTGKDIVRWIGFVRVIRGPEGAFRGHTPYETGITSISMGCTVYIRLVGFTPRRTPLYGLHIFICVKVILCILVAIHAEGHVVGQIATVGSGITCRLI
jgi:hypothetical protein